MKLLMLPQSLRTLKFIIFKDLIFIMLLCLVFILCYLNLSDIIDNQYRHVHNLKFEIGAVKEEINEIKKDIERFNYINYEIKNAGANKSNLDPDTIKKIISDLKFYYNLPDPMNLNIKISNLKENILFDKRIDLKLHLYSDNDLEVYNFLSSFEHNIDGVVNYKNFSIKKSNDLAFNNRLESNIELSIYKIGVVKK